jgi:hypothetical protein
MIQLAGDTLNFDSLNRAGRSEGAGSRGPLMGKFRRSHVRGLNRECFVVSSVVAIMKLSV